MTPTSEQPNRKCTICGFVLSGSEPPPPHCPECGAVPAMFQPTDEPPHGIPHNPFQPHDNRDQVGGVVGPTAHGCWETD
jgi:rubredoxin